MGVRRMILDMTEQPTYSQWLRSARMRQGLTQEELADRSGFDDSYINKVERGHIKLPTYETRQRIHTVLGTSDDDLRSLGIIRDATFRVEPAVGSTATAAGGTVRVLSSQTAEDKRRRLFASLTDEQRALLLDLLAGVITLDEIPDDDTPRRSATRSS
jgi:transcriptional regulator with XRE-family HTH domain